MMPLSRLAQKLLCVLGSRIHSSVFSVLPGGFGKELVCTNQPLGLEVSNSSGFKLRECRFRLGIRKKFFTMKVVKHWNRLPREVVEAPSLETFKTRLDGALSNLISLKMSLLTAGRLGYMTSKVPSKPQHFMIL